jgi:undecaprenyl diphosphate synthase
VNFAVDVQPGGMDHVVLAGGTPGEWLDMTVEQWRVRLADLAKGARAGGAHWVTVLPHHGDEFSVDEHKKFRSLMLETGRVSPVSPDDVRLVSDLKHGLHIIIDPRADGHQRFAQMVEELRLSGTDPDTIDEVFLTRAIMHPADQDVDLVIILGPPNQIPDSMVWELAYSELVFLDMSWSELSDTHLELAIDDFNRRHRRFGGLDS